MNSILDEEKYSDKELFEMKTSPDVIASLDEKCKEKSTLFKDAVQKRDFERCFHEMCKSMDIEIKENGFIYFLDFDYTMYKTSPNITPAYDIILKSGLTQLKYEDEDCPFAKRYNAVVDDLIMMSKRIAEEIKDSKRKKWFMDMSDKPAHGFEEAIQRILFLNQMIWQGGTLLLGLGRLDSLLIPYYEEDRKNGILTRESAYEMIMSFLNILHEHYWFKSSVMLGDTGQVIILGGSDFEGNYIRNELTDIFLEAVTASGQSDPKIVLRVNKNIPKDLMEKAVRCMKTGNGSPLLANDDVIIPRLIDFGITKEDAYEYATSACWEPLIGGKSSSSNNEGSLSYMRALHNLLYEENLKNISSFDELLSKYTDYLRRECIFIQKTITERIYLRNTLYSVFMHGCKETKKDITDGGAIYHNVGITAIALGNAVNALLNIKELVYTKKEYSLLDVKKAIVHNFEGQDELFAGLKNMSVRYGVDDESAIELTKKLTRFVSGCTTKFRDRNGGKLKFGMSSPQYIMEGDKAQASFDGRKTGDPFIVHISNENAASYTELINFAAEMDYGENRFNGNVLDFMVNPSFVEKHFDKFTELLLNGINVGFFQLQANMISSEVLIAAKKNPDAYTGLIVRVWGFSAYFVELSENYQNLLIERALRNEGKIA